MTSSGKIAQQDRKRRTIGFLGWVWRILLGLIALVVLLACAGLAYQAVATQIDRQKFPPPGQRLDVGGYHLHIHCVGQGSPTVVLDAGGGNSSASWGLVQPAVASSTRVCAYDRAGMGWSDLGPTRRDMKQQVRELHALLDRAGVQDSYVLVGHSYGARIARVYAKDYPREVDGIVLVDPGTLDDDPRFPPERHTELAGEERQVSLARWLAPFGVVRLLQPQSPYGDLSRQQGGANDAFGVTTKYFRAITDQYRAMPETYRQEREVTTLGSMPLIVVSATTPDDATRRVWTEINGELAGLSTNGVHRVVQAATHESLLWKNEDAQVTVAAIRQVVDAVRTGQPLQAR
jgi:pimeloyl-ACP methyl ester carboxylesterase